MWKDRSGTDGGGGAPLLSLCEATAAALSESASYAPSWARVQWCPGPEFEQAAAAVHRMSEIRWRSTGDGSMAAVDDGAGEVCALSLAPLAAFAEAGSVEIVDFGEQEAVAASEQRGHRRCLAPVAALWRRCGQAAC